MCRKPVHVWDSVTYDYGTGSMTFCGPCFPSINTVWEGEGTRLIWSRAALEEALKLDPQKTEVYFLLNPPETALRQNHSN